MIVRVQPRFETLPRAKKLFGDKGYDADWFRKTLAERGITACIPSKSNRKNADWTCAINRWNS